MANYHIEVFNRLYQVVDSKTKRIIATFISEADAQSFLQTMYAKMFQEKKDIIANQFLLSKNSDNFFNKAISGDITNEYGNFDDSNYEEDDITDLEGEFDDVDPIAEKRDLSSTADLSIADYNLPKDYWNVIKKDKEVLNNLDDISLGEASNYSGLNKGFNTESNSQTSEFPPNVITNNYDNLENKTSEYVYLDSATNSTINAADLETVQFNNKTLSNTQQPTQQNQYDLKSIYSGFLGGDDKTLDSLNDNLNTSIQQPAEKTFELPDVVVGKNDTNVLDLGPIEEEDDIFSTPRHDEMSERDMEKAILAGTLKILSPKEQKKEDKRLKKLQKLENRKK